MKFKWYTDGKSTIKVREGEEVPEGYSPGRTFNSNPWNKGLTKEQDPRLAVLSSSTWKKGNIPWNKGLTTTNSDKLREVGEHISIANKGKRAWNRGRSMSEESRKKLSTARMGTASPIKGLTKEEVPYLRVISEKLKGHKVSKESIAKGWHTKHLNGTCSSSKPEDDMYLDLTSRYGEDNVYRNYDEDPRYPFAVDFYIKSEDLFIELNLFWMHNDHPFDPSSEEDVETLRKWETKTSPQYKVATEVWSVKDPLKLETARRNHLNFKFIYKNIVLTC